MFDIIRQALPNTIALSVVTLLTLYPVGITLGIIQAVRRGAPHEAETAFGAGGTWHRRGQCSTAMTVSPPRTVLPTLTRISAVVGRNTSIRDPNFMTP